MRLLLRLMLLPLLLLALPLALMLLLLLPLLPCRTGCGVARRAAAGVLLLLLAVTRCLCLPTLPQPWRRSSCRRWVGSSPRHCRPRHAPWTVQPQYTAAWCAWETCAGATGC